MKVGIFSTKEFEVESIKNSNNNQHELLFIKKSLSLDTVEMAKGCSAICVFTNDDVSAKVIEKLKTLNIQFIANRAAGYDHIDLNKAIELNIKVANVPEYSPNAIAEHAVALMLGLNRKLILADKLVKENNFSLDNLIGFDLNKKTVGIVGLGRIGAIVTKILHGFGCKILGYDLEQNDELKLKYNLEYCDLNKLCKNSDIISIHLPLNPHTKYIISKETLNLMKDGVMIINTGRGGLLNTIDAIDALKSGKIGYLGLDVYENEKGLFFYDHSNEILKDDLLARLLAFKNVLITGHQAFLTVNALENIADTTIYNINCWAKGKDSENELIKK